MDSEPTSAPRSNSTRTELRVTGMNCQNCVRHVTEALQGVPGVTSATVVLDTQRATIRWGSDAPVQVDTLLQAVNRAGYQAQPAEPSETTGSGQAEETQSNQHRWHLNLWIGVVCTAPLILGEWVFGLAMAPWFRWLSFGLATTVQLVAGAPFYRGAWTQLKAGQFNMDTLVSLGSTTAYAYSLWALFSRAETHLYFMEAAAIITLISVGHWIEAQVSAKASDALQALLNLAPAQARRRHSDGREAIVSVSELQAEDQVILSPGDKVPTDGVVLEGASAVDESMLTGESVPVDKDPNAQLYAGTVNLNGRLLMRVSATGEETALAHIIAAVQRAQSSRANIQRLADRISNVFVPLVVSVAIATALWWGLLPETARLVNEWLAGYLWTVTLPDTALASAVIGAAAVLIIACPCAMGLATPAAIMAGSNAAARRGILVRDGVALEKAGHVTAVIFDKTGTLTLGKPEVAVFEPVADSGGATPPKEEAMGLAVALARHSNHPISQAVAKLDAPAASIANWQEIRGAGLQGQWQESGLAGGESRVRLGALSWLEQSGVSLSRARPFTETWARQGATVLGLASGQTLRGLIAVKDTVKTGARAVVDQLQQQGLKIHLVTGDNRLTAVEIARQTGIPERRVFAEVRPERKAEFVKKLQKQGERVAFVGDGMNDAPALEQADLGIAVTRASDIAREAADMILLKSEIEAVPESLGLARATLRTIKQNLFWAFFYNALGVPLAALGFLSPVLCALAMGLSDLIVIGNALRLRSWRGPRAGCYGSRTR